MFVVWSRLFDIATPPIEFLSFPNYLKAIPVEEAGERYLYMEASNEAPDYQGEVVMCKALANSADYFEKYGNVDIQHRSITGLANGDPNYHLHEIGRPERVRIDNARTFVKAVIYQGDTPVAACANDFWDSVTKLKPAQRWYPSVAGRITDDHREVDAKTKQKRRFIKSVIWCNVGLSRTPVNPKVPVVSTVPFGVLAKCWGTNGLDLSKALTAGYGTDMATLDGGAALRAQSLDPDLQRYREYRQRMAHDLRVGNVAADRQSRHAHAVAQYGATPGEADAWEDRFLKDLSAAIAERMRP